jgi:hypothetical protein
MRFDRARADVFIRQNWRGLAAAGWNAYVEHGRGAVVISWDALEEQAEFFDTMYGADAEDPEIQQLIVTYDPQTSIVVSFVSAKAGPLATIVVSGSPPPYEAAVVLTH